MQLNYRILWFDDQLGNIKPFIDRISGIINRLGFEPQIDFREVVAGTGDPLVNLPSQNEVDLVLMDWKLGGDIDGAILARRLRQSFCDTDIVFYSSEPAANLRKIIFDQSIDGVFCCNRTNLSDRANGIIQGQLRKILDLNHMRGIVMAATSDLDQGMIECLEVVQQVAYPSDARIYAGDIARQVTASLRRKADEIEKLGTNGRLEKLLHEPAFNAALRLTVLQKGIEKLSDRLVEPYLLESLDRYHTDVITPRNDFAHRKAELKDGRLALAGRDESFDQAGMIALRLRLLSHSDNLRALLSLLQEMVDAAGKNKLAEQISKVSQAVAKMDRVVTSGGDIDG
ncbi:CheY-like chemotaxis protein [Skermanella aerolata]|uniref:hypothetical protein n=1 Tax=Skermanella aerolata TaxID=393310 RepID=UPI003D1D7CD9